jgi:hypothetical protein
VRPNSQQRVALNVKPKGRGRQHAGTFPSDVPVKAHESAIHDHEVLSPLVPNQDEVLSTRPYYRSRQSSLPVFSSTSRDKQRGKQACLVTSSAPLLDDARTEHMLLAARRIGRQRAGILSGILVRQDQDEYNFEAKNAHLPTIPTEQTFSGGKATPTAFVYVNTPGTVLADGWEHHHTKTARPRDSSSPHDSPLVYGPRPGPMHTVSPQRHFPSSQSPKTLSGLDSLVNAARSMLDTKSDENWSRESNFDRSLKPKRRKLSVEDEPPPRVGLIRVKSALDVLADHAAGLSSKDMGASVHVTMSDGRKGQETMIDANSNTNTNPVVPARPADSAADVLATIDDERVDSAETGIRVGNEVDQTGQNQLLMEFRATALGGFRPICALEDGTRTSTRLNREDMLPLKSGLEQSLISDSPGVPPSSHLLSALPRSPVPPTPPSPVLLPVISHANSSTPSPEHKRDDDWLPPHPELIFYSDSASGNDRIRHDSTGKKTSASSTWTRGEGEPLTWATTSPPMQTILCQEDLT